MKKFLCMTTILMLGIVLLFVPSKVFGTNNGPSDDACYVRFETSKFKRYVYLPNKVNNSAQSGATYDKSTNTLTLKNLQDKSLTLEINEMGEDFKIKLEGTNYLRSIYAWGFAYGGSINIVGNGRLDVCADDLSEAITVQAEASVATVTIAEESTVNLSAKERVIAIYKTTWLNPLKEINLPNTFPVVNPSTGFTSTDSVKLANGQIIKVEEETHFDPVYKNITAFKPNENGYTSEYTIFTHSNAPENVYGGKHYDSATIGGKKYEDVWQIWGFYRIKDTYYASSESTFVEEKDLATQGYTNTGNTFKTLYYNGPETVEIRKDSNGNQYGFQENTMYLNGEEKHNYYVFDLGESYSINNKAVCILTKNETIDGSKLERIKEYENVYADYWLDLKSLKIAPVQDTKDLKNANVELAYTSTKYTGKEIKPAVTVSYKGITLKKDVDYSVGYSNNIKEGEATVTVKGIGKYIGTNKLSFIILPASGKDISKLKLTLSTKDEPYTGANIKKSITLKNNNTILREYVDYTVAYKNNKKIGTATITIKGKGNYKGKITKKFKIVKANISKLKINVSTSNEKYNGKNKTKSITIKNGSTKLKNGKDYTVEYKNNKKPGKATITIKGKGNYKGKITKNFKIFPNKPTNIKASKKTEKTITLTWKSSTSGAKGYRVYMQNSNTKKWDLKTTVSENSAKISGLKAGTTYTFKICGYIKIDNKNYNGEFTSNIGVKTTKKEDEKEKEIKLSTPKITHLAPTDNKYTKQIKLQWSKVENATGYEIAVYTSRNKSWSIETTTNTSDRTRVVSGLVKDKLTYAYKVRAFAKVNGKKVYSDYSAVSSVVY